MHTLLSITLTRYSASGSTQERVHGQQQCGLPAACHTPTAPALHTQLALPWSKRVIASTRWRDIHTILDSIGQTPSSTAMNKNRNTAATSATSLQLPVVYSSLLPKPATHSYNLSNTNISIATLLSFVSTLVLFVYAAIVQFLKT